MNFEEVREFKNSLYGKDNFLEGKDITVTVVPHVDLFLILECFDRFKIA